MKSWAAVLTMLLCAAPIEAREPVRIQSRWADLGGRVVDRKVSLTTRDGVALEGRVIAVEADALQMDVSKTSNRTTHPKGRQAVSRQAISALRITERRGYGRVIGAVGAVGAAGGIVAASSPNVHEGVGIVLVPLVAGLGALGAGVAGYFIGRKIDTRVTEIVIIN
jgi:hypothetical protein